MRYDIPEALSADIRSASAELAIFTRRYGLDDARTAESRKRFDRLRAIALITTADKHLYALTDNDVTRVTDRLVNR